MSFAALAFVEPLLRALAELGQVALTPVQREAIPAICAGRDVMAAARTGTGKTAAFALPLLHRLASGARAQANHTRALVLAPTRELAVQVGEAFAAYGQYLPLRIEVVYGGVKINPQMMRLRRGVDILVATPGRLLDLCHRNAIKFAQVETLVLDEADRMLDLGFSADIGKIVTLLPPKRQNLLFSATCAEGATLILAEKLLHRPVRIAVDPPNSPAGRVQQWLYEVDKEKKGQLLCRLLDEHDWQQVLVFTRTRSNADRLVAQLVAHGVTALAIHGDKSQGSRARALADFKANTIRVLVATDIVARGIDITELSHVINAELPKVAADYIHRIGRTGRAGLAGRAISLVSADEVHQLSAIETLLGQLLTRELAPGFTPQQRLPLTRLITARPKKPKKPKLVQVPPQDECRDPVKKGEHPPSQPQQSDHQAEAPGAGPGDGVKRK